MIVKQDGYLYRTAYFWHKEENKPIGKVCPVEVIGLAIVSPFISLAAAIAVVWGILTGASIGLWFLERGLAVGAATFSIFGATGFSSAANDLQVIPMMIAGLIGSIEIIVGIVIALLLLGLRERSVRAEWVANFRALRKRCAIWQVV